MRNLLLLAAGLASSSLAQAQTFQHYRGSLHAHSSYSDGNQDGAKTPLQDYQFAALGQQINFYGISEHNHMQAGMHLADFAPGQAQAVQATTPTFAALSGTEWGVISGGGHMLLYGINKLYGWEPGNYDVLVPKNDYQTLMRKINKVPGAFAMFAHPQSGDYGDLAGNAAFSPTADSALVGTPLRSGPAFSTSTTYADLGTDYLSTYQRMLAKGYHVAPTIDQDNHETTFGRETAGRTVVLAPTLTPASILAALRVRRFYASEDWNAQLTLTCAGQPMGSLLSGPAAASLALTYSDPDNELTKSITLYRGVPGSGTNAVAVATAAVGAAALSYTDPAPAGTQAYYYVILVQTDGDRVVSAPIWYQRTTGALATAATTATALPLTVYPNPTAGTATVSYYLPASAVVQAEVFDLAGRRVCVLAAAEPQAAGARTLTVPTLSGGLYGVRLTVDGVVSYAKLVVE